MEFPNGRRFAFTILDDTDDSTLENVAPVYALLDELGLRTTKTVWPLDCPEGSRIYHAADTLQRPEYLAFVHELVGKGFELASHGATMEGSERARTEAGLAFLDGEFGGPGRIHANHGQNLENVYWGAKRFQLPGLAALIGRARGGMRFLGDEEGSPYFWGDLCRERFEYLRNFTFSGLDMLRCNPEMPYRLDSTPFARHWFSTTDVPDAEVFKRRVTRGGLEALEASGGVCIVSTHLGKGYAQDGRVDPDIEATLRFVAGRPGWFVPVAELLDHMRAQQRGDGRLSLLAHARLELRYLADQVRIRLRGV